MSDTLTEAGAINLLKTLRRLAADDPEAAHSGADEILCSVLRYLGSGEVVEAYEAIKPRWCA